MTFEELSALAEKLVSHLQSRLPSEIVPLARAVPVHYEDIPSDALLADGFAPDILGLFSGNPYGSDFAQNDPAPPQIFLYLGNLWDFAETKPRRFAKELRLTYLHELGHYLGWDEYDLLARGLD